MRKHNIFYRIFAVLFAASLLINAFSSPIFAEKTISDLESELSGLNEQSQTLSGELSSIIEQLDSLNKQLAETREALATAKGQEAAQYKAMKNRIKYMYENNSTTLLDSIFASRSMAEFLSRITFVTSISEYDQNAMQKLIDTRKDIAKQEAFLKDTKASLASLQQTLIAKEAELQSRIDLTKKEIVVLETRSVPEGIAARLAFDPAMSMDENVEAMNEAVENTKTGSVTYSVRHFTFEDKEYPENTIMGLRDGKIAVVGEDSLVVLKELLKKEVDDDSAIISIYLGGDVSEDKLEDISEELEELYPDLDVLVYIGGQPLYDFIYSVE